MKEKDDWQFIFLKLFLFCTPFLFGGYHIAVSAVMSIALCLFILVGTVLDNKKSKIEFNITTIVLILITISYLVVSLWAVDSGTAVYGFIKFLPIALFGVAVSYYSNEERLELLNVIPYSGIVMGAVSYALSFIPQCEDFFMVASRLGGFFQYPNAFAAYCLAGIAILLLKDRLTYKNWLLSALLVAIIFLTGSRTVFIFLIVVSVVLLMKISGKNKLRLLTLIGAAVAVSIIVVIATDSVQTVGRYLTISLESSTLLGRILYYKDAIFEVLRHPFGLGYYGYYYSQGSFQTGVYSVAFVHNDALQLLLDIGWIPAAAFFYVVGKSFFSKKTSFTQKLALFIIFGHSMFDFDLQFISVFLVLILTLDFESSVLLTLKKNDIAVFLVSIIIVILNLYFGLVNCLYLMGKYEAVDRIYGADTQSEIQLMTYEDDYNIIASYADSILSRNEYIAIAYDAKANYAFQEGKFTKVIEYKEKALECSRYIIAEYNDFCRKLLIAISIYEKAGDKNSADYCKEKLLSIAEKLQEVKMDTSDIAWKLKDKPSLELDSEYEKYIKELRYEKR